MANTIRTFPRIIKRLYHGFVLFLAFSSSSVLANFSVQYAKSNWKNASVDMHIQDWGIQFPLIIRAKGLKIHGEDFLPDKMLFLRGKENKVLLFETKKKRFLDLNSVHTFFTKKTQDLPTFASNLLFGSLRNVFSFKGFPTTLKQSEWKKQTGGFWEKKIFKKKITLSCQKKESTLLKTSVKQLSLFWKTYPIFIKVFPLLGENYQSWPCPLEDHLVESVKLPGGTWEIKKVIEKKIVLNLKHLRLSKEIPAEAVWQAAQKRVREKLPF